MAIRCSGPAYIPNHPQKVQVGMAGYSWRHAPTKVQVTKPAPMRTRTRSGKGQLQFFFCRLVQNVQVHVLLGHQLPVWLIVRGATNSTAGTDKGEVGPTFLTNFISTASFREYSCQLRPKSIQSINQVYFHRLRSIDTVKDKYRHIYISSRILGIRPVRQIPMFNHNVLE